MALIQTARAVTLSCRQSAWCSITPALDAQKRCCLRLNIENVALGVRAHQLQHITGHHLPKLSTIHLARVIDCVQGRRRRRHVNETGRRGGRKD